MWDFKKGDMIKSTTNYNKEISKGGIYEVVYEHLYHISVRNNKEIIDDYPKVWFEFDPIANRNKKIDNILK